MENSEAENKSKGKLLRHEYRFRELSNSTKCNNIHIIVVPEEEEWGRGWKFYLNKLQLRTSLIWVNKQVFKSKRQRASFKKKKKDKTKQTGQHLVIS